jgi:hypothetical protein
MPGFLLLALAWLVAFCWLVDLGLGDCLAVGLVAVLAGPRVEDRRESPGAFAGFFRPYPMQMADANDFLGGQQD